MEGLALKGQVLPKVYFTYSRKFIGVETGTVSVSVDDPQDIETMKKKLTDEDFSSFLPESREIGTKEWDFKPKNLN